MRTVPFFVVFLAALLVGPLANAQRLLWEQAFIPAGAAGHDFCNNATLIGGQRILLVGSHADPRPATGCATSLRAYFRTYTLGGALVGEKPGRKLNSGPFDFAPSVGGAGYFSAAASSCSNNRTYARLLVQRVTLAGDTGRAWYMGAAPPPATFGGAILVQGNKIVTAGNVMPVGQTGQVQQVQLTCSDTLGRVRWQRSFPRLVYTNDFSSGLVATPRGGYLVTGDAYNLATIGYDHYLIETDSAGSLRRSRIIQPLGPGYNGGSRGTYQCNVLALPNGQGYLVSGTADSTRQFTSYSKIGYVMRLDTALNVQWVYRHPPRLAGTNVSSNYAFRVRLLPNNTVGLLLTDVRGPGTPAVSLAQVDIATGRRLGYYLLLSNSQSTVLPYDWQWVGDGTLLLCGKSLDATVTYFQSYVARWDFRGTPLAARSAGEAAALATFALYPNPTTGPPTLAWRLPPGTRAGQLRLYDPLGRLVQALALPATATGTLAVPGLAPGLYVAHLLDADGHRQGGARKLVVE